MSDIEKNSNAVTFVRREDAGSSVKVARELSRHDLEILLDSPLVPNYETPEGQFVLRTDLDNILGVRFGEDGPLGQQQFRADLFHPGSTRTLSVGKHMLVDWPGPTQSIDYAFYPMLINLLSSARKSNLAKSTQITSSLVNDLAMTSDSIVVQDVSRESRNRKNLIDQSKAGQFANSAYYMGSKRALGAFLVESIANVLPKDGIVVDLMCGSGAASGTFSSVWRTLASDAQIFSQKLAVVQGGGYSLQRAQEVLRDVHNSATSHAEILFESLGGFVAIEDDIFHGGIDSKNLDEYRSFISSFPTIAHPESKGTWNPAKEIQLRRDSRSTEPYCLFAAYFANMYFGLRQCIEIDSLRYAIEQVADSVDKDWCMGALITAASALATNYAGHFAQPRIRKAMDVSTSNFGKIVETRSASIMHEFAVRYLNLAEESENTLNRVEPINGPWRKALDNVSDLVVGREALVYLDAPYTRDEYSRYYHVLETLVRYDYPSATGIGMVPDKKGGDRFRSEFSTRNSAKLNESIIRVIKSVIDLGCTCAWSYASSGDADIVKVVDFVARSSGASVRSFSTPYQHKPQGGWKPKQVTEYLILFEPKN